MSAPGDRWLLDLGNSRLKVAAPPARIKRGNLEPRIAQVQQPAAARRAHAGRTLASPL